MMLFTSQIITLPTPITRIEWEKFEISPNCKQEPYTENKQNIPIKNIYSSRARARVCVCVVSVSDGFI